jgi:lipoate-protein ligase B
VSALGRIGPEPRPRPLAIERLGLVPYEEALALQAARVDAVRAGAAPDTLFLLEHPAVVTLGRRADTAHLRESPAALAARGVALHQVARGGDVTWHAPGQLVGYLVCDLAARGAADVHAFLRRIEAMLIRALDAEGLHAAARPGYTGVFLAASIADGGGPPRKIASIGVGLRGWVTFHGFALNATNDLRGFDAIVPCGLQDVRMTSVAAERRVAPSAELFAATREAVAAAAEAWLG